MIVILFSLQSGQTALDLAANKKMKQLLDVQPLQVCFGHSKTLACVLGTPCSKFVLFKALHYTSIFFNTSFHTETSQSCVKT